MAMESSSAASSGSANKPPIVARKAFIPKEVKPDSWLSWFCYNYDVASDNPAQFVVFNVNSVQNVVSTMFVVVACQIHQNKGFETSF